MALLLSLEASTQVCSVALHKEGKLLAACETKTPRSAAAQIAVMIQEVMAQSKCKPADLNGVIVASGPGSYTGLRIAVATTKGLCYALNIPLISVNTLQLLASQGKDVVAIEATRFDQSKMLFCPMLDARRMEVYCMLLDFNLHEIEPTQAHIIDERSFAEHLEQKAIYFFGEGAQKCIGIINHPNAVFFPHLTPDAKRLGEMGYLKWNRSQFEDVATFEPLYLKDFMIKKPNLV